MKWLDRHADIAYSLLRIVAGFMFSFHGAQKLLGVLGGFRPALGSQLWFAGVIELFGGLAVMLGLGTRVAAFICSGEMAVAYFQVHWKLLLGPHMFPIVNKGELAALYCFVFLFVACKGEGRWSLDRVLRPKARGG
jgi:putative oxidoreductase